MLLLDGVAARRRNNVSYVLPDVTVQPKDEKFLNLIRRHPIISLSLYTEDCTKPEALWVRNMIKRQRCADCGFRCPTVEALEEHLTSTNLHPVYYCCERLFKTKEDFEQHRAASECYDTKGAALYRASIVAPPKVTNDLAMVSLIKLYRGLKRGVALPDEVKWLQDSLGKNECPYCARSCSTLHGVQSHLEATRMHNVYACCNLLFRTSEQMELHKLSSKCWKNGGTIPPEYARKTEEKNESSNSAKGVSGVSELTSGVARSGIQYKHHATDSNGKANTTTHDKQPAN
jgi:hypothetical protein